MQDAPRLHEAVRPGYRSTEFDRARNQYENVAKLMRRSRCFASCRDEQPSNQTIFSKSPIVLILNARILEKPGTFRRVSSLRMKRSPLRKIRLRVDVDSRDKPASADDTTSDICGECPHVTPGRFPFEYQFNSIAHSIGNGAIKSGKRS